MALVTKECNQMWCAQKPDCAV